MYFHCLPMHENFKLPTCAEPEAVGFDLYAPEDGFLDPLSRKVVKLGFASSFTQGFVGLLLDRSGMGAKGIHRFGGVIDPSYRKEWGAILYNSTHELFSWRAGDRLIQVVFMAVEKPEAILVTKLEESGSRTGGFGSTGK